LISLLSYSSSWFNAFVSRLGQSRNSWDCRLFWNRIIKPVIKSRGLLSQDLIGEFVWDIYSFFRFLREIPSLKTYSRIVIFDLFRRVKCSIDCWVNLLKFLHLFSSDWWSRFIHNLSHHCMHLHRVKSSLFFFLFQHSFQRLNSIPHLCDKLIFAFHKSSCFSPFWFLSFFPHFLHIFKL